MSPSNSHTLPAHLHENEVQPVPALVPEEACNHSYVMMRSSRPVPALGARGGLQALMHFDEIGWVAQGGLGTTSTRHSHPRMRAGIGARPPALDEEILPR